MPPQGSPNDPPRVASPPAERPLLVFDGDCGFCRYWIDRWRRATAGRVDYEPYQEVFGRFPEIPIEAFRRSVQLIERDGSVVSGAHAVFQALAHAPGRDWPLWIYRHVPFAPAVTERTYGIVAANRPFFSALTRHLWGAARGPSTFHVSRRILLASMALIYVIAFVSIGAQVEGLAGENGILPAQEYLDAVARQIGVERYWRIPTICWWTGADGAALKGICAAGVVAALLLAAGFAPALCLFVLWALYLSLAGVIQIFLNYQWDALLLETGFLAIFLAPAQLWFRASRARPPSGVALFLMRWLLFRLVFGSGLVKLASGDPNWWSLNALSFHYWTQPLPVWTSWYMNQLPDVVQRLSVAGMFLVELVAPCLIFAPRRLKAAAAATFVLLHVFIGATGNYCFFNILSVALCLSLLDDHVWPERFRRRLVGEPAAQGTIRRRVPLSVSVPVAAAVVITSGVDMLARARLLQRDPGILAAVHDWIDPFRSLNPYGLFAVMTTKRIEIVVEGSDDGTDWKPYEFRWKPGDVERRPAFVEPHQPRLDWQMWFAALSTYQRTPWVERFLGRLLEGSPAVTGLLRTNPFPDHPPRYVRAIAWDYRFTTFAERRESGGWWRRETIGPWSPVLSLRR